MNPIYKIAYCEQYIDLSKLISLKRYRYAELPNSANIHLCFQLVNKPVEIYIGNLDKSIEIENEILKAWEEWKEYEKTPDNRRGK